MKKTGIFKLFDALGQIAESVGEVVTSAGELLVDAELRRKGAKYIVQEASRGINEAQKGLEAGADALGRTIQQGARARIGAGARQLQSVLRNIERQVQEFQRQQQQRDLQAELEHHQKLPVDIQIGDQVFEDMPQEMRSRFWYVLLERPDLAQQLMKRSSSRSHSSSSQTLQPQPAADKPTGPCQEAEALTASDPSGTPSSSHNGNQAAVVCVSGVDADGRDCNASSPELQPGSQLQPGAGAGGQVGSSSAPVSSPQTAGTPQTDAALGSPFASYASSPQPAEEEKAITSTATAAVGCMQQHDGSSSCSSSVQPDTAAAGDAAARGEATAAEVSTPDSDCVTQQQPTEAVDRSPGSSAAAANAAGQISYWAVDPVAAATGGHEQDAAAQECSSDPGIVPPSAEAAAGAAALHSPGTWAAGVEAADADPGGSPIAPSPWEQQGISAPTSVLSSSAVVAPIPDDPAARPDRPASAAGAAASPATLNTAAATQAAKAATAAAAAAGGGGGDEVTATPSASVADGDGWEIVSRNVPTACAGGRGELEAVETVRTLAKSLSEAASLDASRTAQQAVFQAMLEVPWVDGEGIPDSPADGSEYAQLLAAGCGAMEEVIMRDVPRTFPEHPLFSAPEGQQRLLKVLKAYAAADPEVGYCQGMAFPAGVLLMYLPEEPAFRLFRRLMGPDGANLRRYYLPGLEHLKVELSAFELLLSTHQPQLHEHLLNTGLPTLLYAAQWLMTMYSCPFPLHVAARVLDVLLQSDNDSLLLRLGLAVLEALAPQLMELDDFEALITYLKVKPLSWPLHMHRKVFAAALGDIVGDAELTAAATAAREEFARTGRLASFSNRHLSRQITPAGSLHELVPGATGLHTEAVASAAGEAAASCSNSTPAQDAAEDADAARSSRAMQQGGVASSEQQSAEGAAPEGSIKQQRQLSGLTSVQDVAVVGSAASGLVVDELDALVDLMSDLDLLLPGGTSPQASTSMASSSSTSQSPSAAASDAPGSAAPGSG